jgi:hypothetical protein
VDGGWRPLAHILLATFVALAALGVFEGGPRPAAVETSGIRVEYARVLHAGKPSLLRIAVREVDADTAVVELPWRTTRKLEVERISPRPLRQRATPEGMRLEIPAQPGRGLEIDVHFSTRSPGWQDTALRVLSRPLAFRQLVLP